MKVVVREADHGSSIVMPTAAMKDILTQTELDFLDRQGLGPDDVFDVRRLPQRVWKKLIRSENKTVALGKGCREFAHRLKSRSGHCVQCNTVNLGFQKRYRLDQFIYIAGSQKARLVKIGICDKLDQRQRQICFERYGGADDWRLLLSLKVKRAGEIETRILARLSNCFVVGHYWKDGREKTAVELLKCPFTLVKSTLLMLVDDAKLEEPWEDSSSSLYEFSQGG
jgi:hypothetical protein